MKLLRRAWLGPCLVAMTILVLSVILWVAGGLGINSVSWPQRMVEATFWVTALVVPVGGVGYAFMLPPWRALGRAARELLVSLLLATLLTILTLLLRDQGRIVAQAPHPVFYALGGFVAVWSMLTVVLVAAVLLGTAVQVRERHQRLGAAAFAGGLVLAEGAVLSPLAVTLHAFFNRTLGGAGLITWAGLPVDGVAFPWATFDHIILAVAVVGLSLTACLAVVGLRTHRWGADK